MTQLGRLTRVPLRAVWQNEGVHFTPWLAQPENMRLLGDALKLDLEVEAQEKEVGPFRADILCKDTATDRWVLIENQLERTDHGHLGQLLTYAAGLEAVVLVWIAERFTDEHRAALDFLNELGNERLRCFGLEIELWRIGDSAIAPKFNIVSEPNDWSRTVSSLATQAAAGILSPTKQLQLEYWTELSRSISTSGSFLRPQKPLPQHWTVFAVGRSGFHLAAVASTYSSDAESYSDGEIRAEVVFAHSAYAKTAFEVIQSDQDRIEAEFGSPLVWDTSESKLSRKVLVRRPARISDRQQWAEQHSWLQTQLENLHRAFSQRIKQLDLSVHAPGLNSVE